MDEADQPPLVRSLFIEALIDETRLITPALFHALFASKLKVDVGLTLTMNENILTKELHGFMVTLYGVKLSPVIKSEESYSINNPHALNPTSTAKYKMWGITSKG